MAQLPGRLGTPCADSTNNFAGMGLSPEESPGESLMKYASMLALLMLGAPLAATAQVSYSEARIAGDGTLPYDVCSERFESIFERKARLDSEKLENDRETGALARDAGRLADERRRLDLEDAATVRAYNARSEEHNRRVALHNSRVAEMNTAASMLNGDREDALAMCSARDFQVREWNGPLWTTIR